MCIYVYVFTLYLLYLLRTYSVYVYAFLCKWRATNETNNIVEG